MKYLLVVLSITLLVGVIVLTHKPNLTKVPYDNGFYSGSYNTKLPVINPSKK